MIEVLAVFGITLLLITAIPTATHVFVDVRDTSDAVPAHMLLFVILGVMLFFPVMLNMIAGLHIGIAHGLIGPEAVYENPAPPCDAFDLNNETECVLRGYLLPLWFMQGVFIYASSYKAGTTIRDWHDAAAG